MARRNNSSGGLKWALVLKHAPTWARERLSADERDLAFAIVEMSPDDVGSLEELAGLLDDGSVQGQRAAETMTNPTKLRYVLRAAELQEALTRAQQAEWVRHAVPRAIRAGDTTVAEVAQEMGISEAEVRSTFGV